MKLTDKEIDVFTKILEEELVPALGCTEPIAIAYAAATARDILGRLPERIAIKSSGNIIKNVKSVMVPNSGGMKGMCASAAIGVIGGNADKEMEVLEDISESAIEETRRFLETRKIDLQVLETKAALHFVVEIFAGSENASVEIIHQHTNIVRTTKNGKVLFEKPFSEEEKQGDLTDRSGLTVEKILAFASAVEIAPLVPLLDRQIEYNSRIAQEGLTNKYGLNVGSRLLKQAELTSNTDLLIQARAEAAAGSDARMSGSILPVVTNSGSGNQGIVVTIPVVVFANAMHAPREKLLRALIVSNLVAIHQKTSIGRLSAYCGAITAACGSAAGICYLYDGDYQQVCNTITNTLATVSGIFCDGAKPSCAAKISSAVEAAVNGYRLAADDQVFASGDGIVKSDIEETITGIGNIASRGMIDTDKIILDVMLNGNSQNLLNVKS